MTKMKFGEWVGAVIAGNASAKVIKVADSYFDTDALVAVAKAIDLAVFVAQMESRKLSPLESFAIEVLFDLAGWKGSQEAHESYQRYLKEED